MRHCVFLAVLLSLVVSLSKASSATTGETRTAPDDLAYPENNGSLETTNVTTAKPRESSNATTNGSSETTNATTTTPPGLPNGTTNGSSETTNATTTTPPGSSNGTTNGSSETTNATTTTPPGLPNGTTNGSSETTNATTTTPPGSPNGTTNGSSETTNATTTTPPGSPNGTTNGSSETTNATTTTPPGLPNGTTNGSSETTNATTTTPPGSPNGTTNGSSETTNATTTTPPGTTTPSNSSSETTNATTTTPPGTTTPSNTVDFCKNDPCGTNLAKCVSLNSNYTCVCQYGFYYDNWDCHRGKIFPGVIKLKHNLSNSVQNVNSTEYEELLKNVTQFFKAAFVDLQGYKETVIVEIQPAKEVRNYSPIITVTNLFEESSNVNDTVVASAIASIANSSSFVSSYEVTTYCAAFKCDERTTICEESEFPKCKCKDDFTMTEWDERSCSGCRKDCTAEENKYCAQEKGVPTCKCLTNFANITGKCVSCPVGYSGENCNNNSELILIIVGTVLGAIILALVTAVAIISVRSKHKPDPEKKSLIRSGHANPNPSGERQSTMFPRVQTTSGHTNPGYQPNNPYGAPSSNRGPFPARDYEDLYEISREPEGFRMQRRY